MAELTKKLNVKKSGAAAEEIKLYSTLDEVANKGVHIKSDGINCYAAYGDASDSKASNLNYKPSGSSESYKVLREAPSTSSGDGVTITLKARRNNEDFMQDLPPVKLDPGQKFYLNNANAPTIEGYDFVCCNINNFVPTEDQTINVYYIPQTIPDRIKTDWSRNTYGNPSSATGDLSLTDYANTYSATNMLGMFFGSTITAPPKLNMSNVSCFSGMFQWNYSSSTTPKIANIDARGWDVGKSTNMDNMFNGCKNLKTLNASTWDVSNVLIMAGMFGSCDSLTTLDISGWDPKKIVNTSNMFIGCQSLIALDASGWNVFSISDMSNMFSGCSSLSTLDLSGWTPFSTNNMSEMFRGCSSLSTLDLSGWGSTSTNNTSYMFYDCSSLSTLNLSGWNPFSANDMSNMFSGCSSLSTLDLSGWSTGGVTNTSSMFGGCSNLTSITGVIDMSACTDCNGMFNNCDNLTDVHLCNVPRSLDLTNIGGTEGTTYIIDNYLD